MSRYVRPLGILTGMAARRALEEGHALPLNGGPLAFALVEIVERNQGRVERRIARAPDLAAGLASHTAPRPQYSGIEMGSPALMGIVNVTPDSFSDGGRYIDPEAAVTHALSLLEDGAALVDIGGESTRPGAVSVGADAEIGRIAPVIAGIRARAPEAAISVDTRNARTMRAALDAGATLINDVSAFTHDPDSLAVVAEARCPVVLMHMRGEPATMQTAPAYDDVALDVYDDLEARIAACLEAGVARARIAIDPGIGFGKTAAHNLALLDQLSLFHGLGVPVLVGVSRKRFIASLAANVEPGARLPGSLAAGLAAVAQGAQMLRVHDVAETVQALRVWQAARGV